MKYCCIGLLFTFLICHAYAQSTSYSTANVHSHNDYEQAVPFFAAYNAGFGSIEADIFLHNDSLIVGHTEKDLPLARTLENMYLKPLSKKIVANNGYPYKDTLQQLQLMIDIKTDSIATLDKLISVLKTYPTIINAHRLIISISGNRPPQNKFTAYPFFIWFDGVLNKTYTAEALTKIVMLSDALPRYTKWNGTDELNMNDYNSIKALVDKTHALNKKIRFWAAPDNEKAWATLMRLHVDYLNTDHIEAISSFLKNSKSK